MSPLVLAGSSSDRHTSEQNMFFFCVCVIHYHLWACLEIEYRSFMASASSHFVCATGRVESHDSLIISCHCDRRLIEGHRTKFHNIQNLSQNTDTWQEHRNVMVTRNAQQSVSCIQKLRYSAVQDSVEWRGWLTWAEGWEFCTTCRHKYNLQKVKKQVTAFYNKMWVKRIESHLCL